MWATTQENPKTDWTVESHVSKNAKRGALANEWAIIPGKPPPYVAENAILGGGTRHPELFGRRRPRDHVKK